MASVSKRTWGEAGETKTAWIVRYTEVHKGAVVKRQKTFKRRDDAKAYRTRVESQIAAGTHVAPNATPTVAEACETYLRAAEDRMNEGRLSRTRYVNLKIFVDRSLIPTIGKMRLADLTPHRVEDLYRELVHEKGLAPRTAKERIYILCEVEKLAHRRGLIKARPASEGIKELKGIRQEPIRTLKPEEVEKIIAAAETKNWKGQFRTSALMRCSVHLAAFCGLRFGEIAGLTLANVDLDQRSIRVRHSLDRFDKLKGPKTAAGVRDVPMSVHVRDLVADFIARYYIPNERGIIFTSNTGTGHKTVHHHVAWKALLKRAGLEAADSFHFHALRHFCASWLVSNGLPIAEVARLLGHRTFDVTLQVYTHALFDRAAQHEALDRVVSAFMDARPPMRLDAPRTQEALTI